MPVQKNKIKFGFSVPIFAHPGVLFFRTPAYKKLDWKSIENTVLLAEKLGYDSLFVADHVFLGNRGEIWEAVATMSALAAKTSRMEISPIHLCDSFRNPALVAKTFATLSHISNGRIILFYDYGWRKKEFDAYGFGFEKTDKDRIKKMGEGLTIIKGMLTKRNFSFNGKYYHVRNAICNPKPIKKIKIWMGETDNPEMVRQVVSHADVFNSTPCTPKRYKEKLDLLEKECKNQGRKFGTLGLSLETQVLIRKDKKEIEKLLKKYKKLKQYNHSFDKDKLSEIERDNPELSQGSPLILKREFLIGTPEEIREQLDQFISLGINHFMLWFMDYPNVSGLKLFAKEVFPYYK
jgi:alkanesulfonate monooxygenase SsuD/methylene tetrahydromethanopterin reductase-like flavin-dependent oxidoreductase (luciferase family)